MKECRVVASAKHFARTDLLEKLLRIEDERRNGFRPADLDPQMVVDERLPTRNRHIERPFAVRPLGESIASESDAQRLAKSVRVEIQLVTQRLKFPKLFFAA